MDESEKSLYDNVGSWLHEMTWKCDYPINHSIALWSFLEGFREQGFDVSINNDRRTAIFSALVELDGEHRFFEALRSYDQILGGWTGDLQAAPRTLYNSIYSTLDQMGSLLKNKEKPFPPSVAESQWDRIRNGQLPRDIRTNMEGHILEHFNKYHEHMLLPVTGKISELKSPEVFFEVIGGYPLDVFRYACMRDHRMKDKLRCGPCSETLVDMKEWRFSDSYHPSESAMIDYFWGMYLQQIQEIKQYPFRYQRSSLRELVGSGEDALMNGRHLSWNYQSR